MGARARSVFIAEQWSGRPTIVCTVVGPKSAAAISRATLPMRSPVICPESASVNPGGHHHKISMKLRRRASTVREAQCVCHYCQLPKLAVMDDIDHCLFET